MMTNMKAVLLTDESRASPNVPDGLTKGWIFNGYNCSKGPSIDPCGMPHIICLAEEV